MLTTGAPAQSPIVGTAKVIDGDTIEINLQRIRLFGIDAFETEQTCGNYYAGKAAADYLVTTIRNPVRCWPEGRSYGRIVAICVDAHGKDIAQAMVSAGHALADTTYSLRYADDARSARTRGVGAHTQNCKTPWAWRRYREAPTPLRR
jgi:endonuclease YncB( thermonuclease family)